MSPIVGTIMDPERCLCFKSQNLGICYITWQRGIMYGIKMELQIEFRMQISRWWGDCGLYGWTQCNHKILKSGRRRQRFQNRREMWLGKNGQRDASLLAWKTEEEATGQGMGVASGSWKRQRNRFSPRASRRNILILAHWDLFWTFDLSNYKMINLGCLKPLHLW